MYGFVYVTNVTLIIEHMVMRITIKLSMAKFQFIDCHIKALSQAFKGIGFSLAEHT